LFEKIKGFLSVRPRIGLIWVGSSVIHRFKHGIMSFLLIRRSARDVIARFSVYTTEDAIATFLKTEMDVFFQSAVSTALRSGRVHPVRKYRRERRPFAQRTLEPLLPASA